MKKEDDVLTEGKDLPDKASASEAQEEAKDAEEKGQPKGGNTILKEQIQMALMEYRRHNRALFFSSVSGGLEIGFSLLLMGILYTMFYDQMTKSGLDFALAFAYPIGFIFVILGRSELFTEHTTLAVLPVLNRSVSVTHLLELWGVIFVGNLLGGYLFAFLLTRIGPPMELISQEAFVYLAEKMLRFGWWITLCSAIIAGWLMGLLSWLNSSSQETISRIFIIILVTATIGLGGMHHSIVGSIEVFAGFICSPEITLGDYLFFQLWATLGNIIGGTVFVAIVKYSHLGKETFIHRS